ncbi:MAG TPA: DNA alkylation repair protein [Mucilaginibacter sp.]|jgi:3-methyladenine DNA glycosylase AlkD|nr:DNA alkylation repair protein [Mucilaginibacter sp.]
MNVDEVIDLLKQSADASRLEGMKRYAIDTTKALGVTMPEIRKLAKEIKKDHPLALRLWKTGIRECQILASLIDDPKQVTPRQMDNWVAVFNSWEVCDQTCGNLFVRTPYAIEKAFEYSSSEREFIKRAGFVLMAEMQVHNKKVKDEELMEFFPVIEREAWDDRNFVKKAVNWALRQIGKRNSSLRQVAIAVSKRIAQQETKSAKWIAKDALAELEKRS